MDVVEVRMLGPLLVRRGNGSVVGADEWRSNKTLDLLRLLALNAGRPMSVASVVDRLWPAVDWDHGRASLRTAASQLRKVLDADCLERQAGCIGVTGIWFDTWAYTRFVHEVEQARRAGEGETVVRLVREAEGLYAGDVEVTTGDWDGEAHDWFRAQRLRMLLAGAEAAASRGWMRDSLDFAERARSVELTEEVARALMRAMAGLGEAARALDVFGRLSRDLADRLGVDPSPQTKALHMQVLSGSSAPERHWEPVGVAGPVAELVGAARNILDGSAAGSVVWLCGEEGSGRRTVAEAAARELGLPVYDLSNLPFDAFAPEVLDSKESAAAPGLVMLPSRSLPPTWAVSIVHQLAKRCPGVVVVRAAEPPTDVVVGEPGDDTVVRVGRLTVPAFTELARTLVQGVPSPAFVDELWQRSGGLAGVACEVVREWLAESRVVWDANGLGLVTDQPPEDAAPNPSVVTALRTADAASLDVLSVLAVAGSTLQPAVVGRVLHSLHRPGDADEILQRLVDDGLVERSPGGFRLARGPVNGELAAWLRPSVASAIEDVLDTLAREDVVVQARRLAAQGQTALAMAVTRDELRLARQVGDLDGVREMVGLLRELRRAHASGRGSRYLRVLASPTGGGIPEPRSVSTPVAAAWQYG